MDYGDNLLKSRILIIAPHSDDETYGCGGLIAKMKDKGGEVFCILVSIGTLSQYTVDGKKEIGSETREKEFEAVMKYLKIDDWEILFKEKEKHLRLDAIPRRDLIRLLEEESRLAINKIKPDIVALPSISYNQDHEAVFKAGFTACRPTIPGRWFVKTVLAYDSSPIFWSMEREKFHPNFYVDISDYLDKKLKAFGLHISQLKPSPHHGSLESIEHLARMRGREISAEAAEAYIALRLVL